MAKRADAETVQSDMQPPNYRGAVQKMRLIPAKKDRISSITGEIGDIYAKVEGMKCNRKGAKIFYALDRMEQSERDDVLRTLEGLLAAAGYDEENRTDLMDIAEGARVLPMRRTVPASENQADDVDEAVGEDGDIPAPDDVDDVVSDIVEGQLVEDPTGLAGSGEAIQMEGDNGGAEPIARSDDGFTEATPEELAAQAGRGEGEKKGGGRKGSVSKIANLHDNTNLRQLRG